MASLMIPAPSAADETLRVLFIGNSYTRYNDLPRQVESIAESVPEGPRIVAHRETHGGYDLRGHWRQRRVRRRIERGRWDAVVIQPHSLSPISRREELTEYARRFQAHAHAAGARLVLFETWARHPESRAYDRFEELEDPQQMHARLAGVYRELGAELGAVVAPVGRAWMRALSERPTLRLHRSDGTHPALPGTYLSACVVYGTLTGRDPRAARWRPYRLPRHTADEIRAIAAQSL